MGKAEGVAVFICKWWGLGEKAVYPKSHEMYVFANTFSPPMISLHWCLELPGNLESELRHWGGSLMCYRALA